jgi:pectin methylesterase-like acyl-CoA thioesterase
MFLKKRGWGLTFAVLVLLCSAVLVLSGTVGMVEADEADRTVTNETTRLTYDSIQAAIDADETTDDDIITVGAGVYGDYK